MNKSNLFTILSTIILSLFLITGYSFADGDGHSLDAADGDPTDVVYVDNDGNVGIGTDSPDSALHILGEAITRLKIQGSVPNILLRDTDKSGYYEIRAVNQHLYIRADPGDDDSGSTIQFEVDGDELMRVDDSGNVGIGTADPNTKLDIRDEDDTAYTTFTSDQTMGGTTILEIRNIKSDTATSERSAMINFLTYSGTNSPGRSGIGSVSDGSKQGNLVFWTQGGTNNVYERMRIDSSGRVGIGTTSPDYKLDVLGTIRAEEVKVETGWSDFVFEDDYNLPSLDHVETFIKQNKHLPDIPSGEEIEENGLSMAEMMAKQMQKIEELTLYVIEQSKKMEEQNKQIEALKEELAELKNMN